MNEKTKSLIIKFLFIITTFCITLLLIELGFRIYGVINDIDFRLYSKELKNSDRLPTELFNNAAIVPGTKAVATTSDFSVIYSINSKGFRDKEYSYEKTPNKLRISMYGDSFTFGEGVAYGKRFSDIVENNIPNTEILTFGVPGISLDNIISRIFTEGFYYKPDYIVIILNRYVLRREGPDIVDLKKLLDYSASDSANNNPLFIDSINSEHIYRQDPFFVYKPNFILRHSYFASYVHYMYSVFTLKQQFDDYDRTIWSFFRACENKPNCDVVQNIDLKVRTINLLDKLNTTCKEKNIDLIVINIDSEPLQYFYDTVPLFQYFDLYTDIKKESLKHPLSFKYDHHYNEKTNEFLGSKMTEIFHQIIAKHE